MENVEHSTFNIEHPSGPVLGRLWMLGVEVASLDSFEDGRGRYGCVGWNRSIAGNVVCRLRLAIGAAGQHPQQIVAVWTVGSHSQKRNRFKMEELNREKPSSGWKRGLPTYGEGRRSQGFCRIHINPIIIIKMLWTSKKD